MREGTTLRDLLERGLRLAREAPPAKQGAQFHWKCVPARMQQALSNLSVNQMIDLTRSEADARAMGLSSEGQ